MRVRGVVWAGTRTAAFGETVDFFRDVLGVPLVEVHSAFAWASMPDTTQFEVFGDDDADHAHFATGPVVEFLVDDITGALAELVERGVPIVGTPVVQQDDGWLHFRAPDGNVYGLTSGSQYRR